MKLIWQIWLKREDLQPVFSFKIRGAYNMMAHLSAEEKANGVITCSAGKAIYHSCRISCADSQVITPRESHCPEKLSVLSLLS